MDSSREQFSQIYDQYIEKIYRFVYLKVNSQEIAEDLTSKVFLNGWQAYQKNSETIENQGAFLYKIARNAVIDHYREKGRAKIVSADYLTQIPDQKTDLQGKAILSSDVETVRLAIQNIKQDYQDIIIWHYLDDMPIEQVAQNMDKTVGTARVMLHRALKALKKECNKNINFSS